jgi:hypothetical protein
MAAKDYTKYQLLHNGEVIRHDNTSTNAAVEVALDEDPTRPLGWCKSVEVFLDPERDQVTVQVTTSGGGEKTYPMIVRRITRPGREHPQLLLTLPENGMRLANGDIVIG